MIIRRQLTANFTMIPNDAILDERLTIGARWLLCYLLSRPNDWEVRIADIQKKGAVGREKAYAMVKELIGLGWIRKDEARQKDGKWNGIEYVVMMEPEIAVVAKTPFPENPHTAEPLAANHHLTKDLPLPNTERTNISADAEAELEAEFEEFWAAYPKRPNNPRKPAMVAFKKARRNVSQKQLLTAVGEYAAFMAGEPPKYVAMAATWLNGERWTCDYSKGADVISAHKGIMRGGNPDPIDMALLTKLVAAYPGVTTNLDAVVDAIIRQKAEGELPEIIIAAEKYALLVKQRRDDGWEPEVPTLDKFIKFRWREMNAYEFCRVGQLMKLAVRPKKVSA